jgi:hypothetical protein
VCLIELIRPELMLWEWRFGFFFPNGMGFVGTIEKKKNFG